MKANEAAAALGLTCLNAPEQEQEVTGGYAGDLLSWVIGRAEPGNAWMTIMSNVNVAAVALMADVSMIVLAEGVEPDEALLRKVRDNGLGLYSSPLGAYELSWRLHGLLS
ncbi:MAG: hypothetical protein IK136_04570 [Oscillospiraceae bacterium]|nr:hypothetical protein [Oscillospiraceae bacterium]